MLEILFTILSCIHGADRENEQAALAESLATLSEGFQASISNLEYSMKVRFHPIEMDPTKRYVDADEEHYEFKILDAMSMSSKQVIKDGVTTKSRIRMFDGARLLGFNPDSTTAFIDNSDSVDVLSKSDIHDVLMVAPSEYHRVRFEKRWAETLAILLRKYAGTDQLSIVEETDSQYGALVYKIQIANIFTIWMDIDHGGMVRKKIRYLGPKENRYPFSVTEVSELHEIEGTWFPATVRQIYHSAPDPLEANSAPKVSFEAEVVIDANSLKIGQLKESDFKVDLPPGTTIIDKPSGTVLNVVDASYLVRADVLEKLAVDFTSGVIVDPQDVPGLSEKGGPEKPILNRTVQWVTLTLTSLLTMAIIVVVVWTRLRNGKTSAKGV